MSDHPQAIEVTTTVLLTEPTTALAACFVPAVLRYTPTDPYAVSMRFVGIGENGDDVVRLYARDILARGRYLPTGRSDAHVQPSGTSFDTIDIFLNAPKGALRLKAPKSVITHFLTQTFDVVPQGREDEWMNLDMEIDYLLYHWGKA